MLCYFLFALLFAVAFMKLFIDKISRTRFFRKEETVAGIKKPCIGTLHKHKAATPSMGGLVLNVTLLLFTVVYFIATAQVLWFALVLLPFGAVGFADDYIKLKKVGDGVTPKQKLLGQSIAAVLCVAVLSFSGSIVPHIRIPFVQGTFEIHPPVYLVLLVILIAASSNSVNITDGLDGLALGISCLVFGFILLYAYRIQDTEALFVAAVLEAACLAALFFNRHPARIFMGDTGSLLLGGAIAVLLIRLGLPLFLPLVLIVCLFETVSVILQLFSLRFLNRRIFKIAPFHHHLETCGWKETSVVYVFWGITGISCVLAYLGIV